MIDYLQKLVSLYPVTSNQASVKQLLDYVGAHFEARGMTATHHTYAGIHNLYISTTNTKHSKVLLQSHVDVVPGKHAFYLQNDKAFGRGVYDMLYAVAAFMHLADEIPMRNYDLAFMLSGDEETGGFSGVRRLLQAGYTADICILPDAGNGFGSLNVGAKGVFNVTVRIHGRAHHGSRPWEGDGAAAKLIRFLSGLETVFDVSDQHNSTMTIAQLQAGDASNQGPSTADAVLDIRYKDQDDLRRIEKAIDALLQRHNGEIITTRRGSDYQLDVTHPLVKHFIEMYGTHAGKKIELTKAHGSSDARFFSERGIPVIMLRPDGGGAHGDVEWLSLASYTAFYDLLKEYVVSVATKV